MEVVVSVAIVVMTIAAAGSLLGTLVAQTRTIERQDKVRLVARQIDERIRAYGCSTAHLNEEDATLLTKMNACKNGLAAGSSGIGALQFGACGGTASNNYLGDMNLCWSDGARSYDVDVDTWWEISSLGNQVPPVDPFCPTPGTTTMPDTLARKITVTEKAGSGASLTTVGDPVSVIVREAAPSNPNLRAGANKFRRLATTGSVSRTVTSGGVSELVSIAHTPPAFTCTTGGAGAVLYPYSTASESGASATW